MKLSKITCVAYLIISNFYAGVADTITLDCCGSYRNDTIAPTSKSQHLLEENFSCATHRRKEDDRAPDAFRPGIVQWPDFAVIVIHNNLSTINISHIAKGTESQGYHMVQFLTKWSNLTSWSCEDETIEYNL